jgi:hypothetical protein
MHTLTFSSAAPDVFLPACALFTTGRFARMMLEGGGGGGGGGPQLIPPPHHGLS